MGGEGLLPTELTSAPTAAVEAPRKNAMRVLVLGGTGFIGPAAVRRIVARGHEVTLFHRGKTHSDQLPEVPRLHGDRADLASFAPVFADLRPEVVLDMMPYCEDEGSQLLRLFRGVARRIVAISSCDVYRAFDRFSGRDPGPPDPTPLTEDSPLRDRLYNYREEGMTPTHRGYWNDKILMERAVQADPERLPATVLRLPMVYGPGDDQHRIAGYVRRMVDGRPFVLLPETISRWKGPRGYVEDVGEAIALCVERPEAAGRTYHVGEASVTEQVWVERIGRALDWEGRVATLPDDRMPTPYPKGDFAPARHLHRLLEDPPRTRVRGGRRPRKGDAGDGRVGAGKRRRRTTRLRSGGRGARRV